MEEQAELLVTGLKEIMKRVLNSVLLWNLLRLSTFHGLWTGSININLRWSMPALAPGWRYTDQTR